MISIFLRWRRYEEKVEKGNSYLRSEIPTRRESGKLTFLISRILSIIKIINYWNKNWKNKLLKWSSQSQSGSSSSRENGIAMAIKLPVGLTHQNTDIIIELEMIKRSDEPTTKTLEYSLLNHTAGFPCSQIYFSQWLSTCETGAFATLRSSNFLRWKDKRSSEHQRGKISEHAFIPFRI